MEVVAEYDMVTNRAPTTGGISVSLLVVLTTDNNTAFPINMVGVRCIVIRGSATRSHIDVYQLAVLTPHSASARWMSVVAFIQSRSESTL